MRDVLVDQKKSARSAAMMKLLCNWPIGLISSAARVRFCAGLSCEPAESAPRVPRQPMRLPYSAGSAPAESKAAVSPVKAGGGDS